MTPAQLRRAAELLHILDMYELRLGEDIKRDAVRLADALDALAGDSLTSAVYKDGRKEGMEEAARICEGVGRPMLIDGAAFYTATGMCAAAIRERSQRAKG